MDYKQNKNLKQGDTAHKRMPANRKKDKVKTFPKWVPVAIVIFTFLLYVKGTQNFFTNLDDDFYIIRNPFLRDFSWNGIKAIFSSFYVGNYHPFTTIIHLFEYRLFALNPVPYHLINILFHTVNTFLVYKFI